MTQLRPIWYMTSEHHTVIRARTSPTMTIRVPSSRGTEMLVSGSLSSLAVVPYVFRREPKGKSAEAFQHLWLEWRNNFHLTDWSHLLYFSMYTTPSQPTPSPYVNCPPNAGSGDTCDLTGANSKVSSVSFQELWYLGRRVHIFISVRFPPPKILSLLSLIY